MLRILARQLHQPPAENLGRERGAETIRADFAVLGCLTRVPQWVRFDAEWALVWVLAVLTEVKKTTAS